jgi:hypothetical protein
MKLTLTFFTCSQISPNENLQNISGANSGPRNVLYQPPSLIWRGRHHQKKLQ